MSDEEKKIYLPVGQFKGVVMSEPRQRGAGPLSAILQVYDVMGKANSAAFSETEIIFWAEAKGEVPRADGLPPFGTSCEVRGKVVLKPRNNGGFFRELQVMQWRVCDVPETHAGMLPPEPRSRPQHTRPAGGSGEW